MEQKTIEPEFIGKTFNDFLLRPQQGVVASRSHVDLTLPVSKHHQLALPIVSANMDSVTESAMAQTLAFEGGLGIIHRSMTIAKQADEVRRVKRQHSYVVEQPICLPRQATIKEARQLMTKHHLTSLLIEATPGSYQLTGLLTNRDLPWHGDFEQHKVEEFMTPREKLITALPDISMSEAEQLLFKHRVEKLPLVTNDGLIKGLITKKDLILSLQRPFSSKDKKGRLLVAAAIGAKGDYLERAEALLDAGVDMLIIDMAHGHSQIMQQAVKALREKFGEVELGAGNVATYEGAKFLQELGVDAIKVGIGPGHGCRTRLETSAGVPQLQAIREAWLAVGDSVPIMADGGIDQDKDIALAIMCGASSVLLGSMLSGTDESPGYLITDPATNQKRKIYRGSTSPQAVFNALNSSNGEENAAAALALPAEGQEVQVPYQGSVIDILKRMRGHLASAVSYAGAATLAEARQKIAAEPLKYLIPLSENSYRESFVR